MSQQSQMTVTELIEDLETIKLSDGDLDLYDKITVKDIHNVAIGKYRFHIFNIPIKYI